MITKEKSIEMYENDLGLKKYINAIEEIQLWKSEKIIIEKYINHNAKILDLGCGAGRTTFGLYNIGYKNILGLDLSSKLINFAINYNKQKNYNIKFVLGDSCKLPFDNENFDFIFYKNIWNEEKKKWNMNQQDKDLEIFGDMIIKENNGTGFIHYSSIKEIEDMIEENTDYKIIKLI